jgi:hypothetical protein
MSTTDEEFRPRLNVIQSGNAKVVNDPRVPV